MQTCLTGSTFYQGAPGGEAVSLAGLRVVQQGELGQGQSRIRHYVGQLQVDASLLAPAHKETWHNWACLTELATNHPR